jgi:signal transduction histidine kinase
MRDSQNRPVHFLKIIEDITDQKMAEQAKLTAIVHERTRIAQDIHDTLAQGFTGILIQLQAAAYAPDQRQARVHIAQASNLARESLQEARRSVHALRPQALEGGNLPGAISQLLALISSPDSMNVGFAVHGIPFPLSADIENHLYRICQEALTNAIRYSQASSVTLDLWFEPDRVHLSIQDDGIGFEAKSGFQGSGFGLVGMSERSAQIGGTMSIESSPGRGTLISISVPPTGGGGHRER